MQRDLQSTVDNAAATVGGSYQQFYYGVNYTQLQVNRLFPDVVAGEQVPFQFNKLVQAMTVDAFDNTDELQSFFARVNFSLKNKWLFFKNQQKITICFKVITFILVYTE